jgi:hypothetical protein
MTRTERSQFRAYCKAEAERFEAANPRFAKMMREREAKQARAARRVRIGIYIISAIVIINTVQFFFKF